MSDAERRGIIRLILALLLLAGIGLRLAYITRGLDHRLVSPWRQCDFLQMARNFHREDPNILYPRIDWREDSPGYVESEFPLLPWVGARLFDLFGYREWLLRVPSSLLGIASLFLFLRLARAFLPPVGVLLAVACFAFNPLLFHLATALQPEPLMVCASLLAMLFIVQWDARPRTWRLIAASAAIALAILGKAPAVSLGLVLAYVLWRRLGPRMIWTPQVLAAGALALLPPVAWYAWAGRFWKQYGNSLGVSNGYHWLTLGMLLPPAFLLGIVKWETLGVFTPAGVLLAFLAMRAPRERVEIPAVWYLSAWVMYVAAARTTAADWAFYYHSLSVAPGCLLMGAGVSALWEGRAIPGRREWATHRARWLAGVLGLAVVGAHLLAVATFIRHRDARTDLLPLRTCARELARYVPPDGLIVVQGDRKYDELGRPSAYNIPMAFAWMDRKGFNYGTDERSIETLDRIAARGGRYWFVSDDDLEPNDFRTKVAGRYEQIAQCQGGFHLFDLTRRPAGR